MSNDSSYRNNGITFLGALQVLFIGLKLTGYIDWPWMVVLAPLWLDFAVLILAIIILLVL